MDTLLKEIVIVAAALLSISFLLGFLLSKLHAFKRRKFRLFLYITYSIIVLLAFFIYLSTTSFYADFFGYKFTDLSGYGLIFPIWFYIGTRINLLRKNSLIKSSEYLTAKKILGGFMIFSGMIEFFSLSDLNIMQPELSSPLYALILFLGFSKLIFGIALFIYLPKQPTDQLMPFSISDDGSEALIPESSVSAKYFIPPNEVSIKKHFTAQEYKDFATENPITSINETNMDHNKYQHSIFNFAIQIAIKLFALACLISSGSWLFFIYFLDEDWSISSYDDDDMLKFNLVIFPCFVLAISVLVQKLSLYKPSDTQQKINKLKKEIELKELENKLNQLSNK